MDDSAVSQDLYYMARALELAWRGAGMTHPNPLVGAVLVREGRIVGEGYHARAGENHAEVAAMAAAGETARGATLYVTLEPCCHQGKTPPCVPLIASSGVERVVVPTRDPFEKVNGRGIEELRLRGVKVELGCLAERSFLLNLPYFARFQSERTRSVVTLKIATSLDGKVAARPGERTQITVGEGRLFTQKLRAVHRAVLVGIETVLVDSPFLDCRLLEGAKPPVPVVLDTELRFPGDYHWLGAGRDFVVCTASMDEEKIARLSDSGVRVIRCSRGKGGLDLKDVLEKLFSIGLDSVLVEGGSRVFTRFIEQGIWDSMFVLTGPSFLGRRGVSLFNGESPLHPPIAAVASVPVGNGFVQAFLNRDGAARMLEELVREDGVVHRDSRRYR